MPRVLTGVGVGGSAAARIGVDPPLARDVVTRLGEALDRRPDAGGARRPAGGGGTERGGADAVDLVRRG